MRKEKFATIRPNVVWYLFEDCVWANPQQNFERGLKPLFERIYPQELILSMQNSGYNPVLIGYDHSSLLALMRIKMLLGDLKKLRPDSRVGMEILPTEAYNWIAEFLKDEAEYKKRGTLWGKKPSASQVEGLTTYRGKLAQNFSQSLLLWLLENKFPVTVMEHPCAVDWVNQDEHDWRFTETITGIPWRHLRPFYTAIRRDVHGLGVLEKERPDIICVGIYHAIKYDFLLERDGSESHYFLSEQFVEQQLGWDLLLKMWKASHETFLAHPPK